MNVGDAVRTRRGPGVVRALVPWVYDAVPYGRRPIRRGDPHYIVVTHEWGTAMYRAEHVWPR